MIFLALALCCLFTPIVLAQVTGDYRTIASGNFGNTSIWQIYDGASWTAAVVKPSQVNDVYIDQGDSVRLTIDEQVKSLFLNSDTGAAQKLNLNGSNLDIYGSLQAFVGLAPGSSSGTLGSINWIGNSITSTLTFKGGSRIIIPYNAWSGQSTRSRYSVIFDPLPGSELIVEEAFKSLEFTIKTGNVLQTIDNSVDPGKCGTFSFNTETLVFGTGPFGKFVIEAGAKLTSLCNSDILFRSGTSTTPTPAALFHLQPGGELILEGSAPQIEAASFQLDGKVTFRKNTGTQIFFTKAISASVIPTQFHDLEISGSIGVTLPTSLSVNGNISQTGTGSFGLSNTTLLLDGSFDQSISGFPMNVKNLTVNKPAGSVTFQQDLTVKNTLQMDDGGMDFLGKNLTINSDGTGELKYYNGFWKNVGLFTYMNTPLLLTTTNSTYPFLDVFQGGIRKVQLLAQLAVFKS